MLASTVHRRRAFPGATVHQGARFARRMPVGGAMEKKPKKQDKTRARDKKVKVADLQVSNGGSVKGGFAEIQITQKADKSSTKIFS
jgi:hypothetical protein